jgi:hypothetical protein
LRIKNFYAKIVVSVLKALESEAKSGEVINDLKILVQVGVLIPHMEAPKVCL